MATLSVNDVASATPWEQATPQDKVMAIANRHGVDPNLAWSVASRESSGQQAARSPKGAMGVMQLMPSTAASLGVDPAKEDENIEGGVRYLGQLLKKYNGDRSLALAAYNAGPGAVDSHGGVPPYPETQNFVRSVSAGAPPAAPAMIAQSSPPPPAPRAYSPVAPRAAATSAQAPVATAYDPRYEDPLAGARAVARISALHMAGAATSSQAEDWIPYGGQIGQKITATEVRSVDPNLNGLWVGNKKVDPSQNWVRVGLGAGGAGGAAPLKNLQRFEAQDAETGENLVLTYDPTDGTSTVIPGLKPLAHSGVTPTYLYNRTTGTRGWYSKEDLIGDEKTGLIHNRAGNVFEPTPSPQEVDQMKWKLRDQQREDYKILNDKYSNWQGLVQRGELASLRSAFGVALPAEYDKDKKKSMDWLQSYYNDQKAEIEKRFHGGLEQIQRDYEHVEPTSQAAPVTTVKAAPGGARKRVTVKLGSRL